MRFISRTCAAVLAAATLSPAVASAAPILHDVPGRTQVTVRHVSGVTVSTPNAHETRPALSLAKLYLGYWVLKYGAEPDKWQVEEMIRVSHDGIASNLDAKYPQAIDSVARDFGLGATHRNGYWGNSGTSTENLARFVEAIHGDPAAAPLFNGMRNAAPIAADGYRQDFGTATLPGMEGTKFGWADNRNIHASVSIGNGFTVAANTYGNAGDHTADVQRVDLGPQNVVEAAVLNPLEQWRRDMTNQVCGQLNWAADQVGSSRVC